MLLTANPLPASKTRNSRPTRWARTLHRNRRRWGTTDPGGRAAELADVGGNGLLETGREGRMGAAGNPPLGQRGGDFRQVAARLDRQRLGFGDGLTGIPGMELAGVRLDGPCGFGRGDEAQSRKCHDMLTYGTTLFVVWAGATDGLSLRLGNRVVHNGAVGIDLLEDPDDPKAGLIPDGPEGVSVPPIRRVSRHVP